MRSEKIKHIELNEISKFKTGIHTLELKTIEKPITKHCPFVNEVSQRSKKVEGGEIITHKIVINPHRVFSKDGVYQTNYGSLKKHEAAMEEVYTTLWGGRPEDCYISRLDLCLDSDNLPYGKTKRLMSFLAALMAKEIDARNSYLSKDFFTLEDKTARFQNNNKQGSYSTMQIEYYDRTGKEICVYDFSPINRLEFRMMAGKLKPFDERTDKIACFWIEKMKDAINRKQIEAFENELADSLYSYREREHKSLSPTAFLRAHKDFIFTRRQAKRILSQMGNYQGRTLNNKICSTFCSIEGFDFYDHATLETLIEQIGISFYDFLTN